MDILSLAGLLIAFGGILGGQFLEGGSAGILVQGAAFLIVFGGTFGAVMTQSSFDVFLTGIKMAKWVFVPPKMTSKEWVRQISVWGTLARKDGILALEAQVGLNKDPFVQKGLQLLVDGNSAEKIRDVLEIDNHAFEKFNFQAARIWESAAGYSPTIGILGAVMGLVHVMQNLSEPSKLGAGIAVAFVSTLYGVGFANLVYLPVAGKLKTLVSQHLTLREMLVDGLMSIANGENPRYIENKLQGYITYRFGMNKV
jgi:chemotaxis protein MotA